MIRAGTAIVDISPEQGVQLAGYPHCPRENTGIHDPLYAAALHISNGKHAVVIVTLDLLSIGKDIVRELRERTNMNILVSVSHTHSGPWGSEPLASEIEEGISCNPAYIGALKEKLYEAVTAAAKNTFPAKLGTGVGVCGAAQGIGGNRRQKGGLCDDSVNVLSVIDEQNNVRAVLVNYALHPTYLHAENTLVTADYPCYIRRYFQFARPEAVVLFAQGTSGDQSARYHRTGQSFEEAARAGTTIAVGADSVLDKIQYCDDMEIAVKSIEIADLPLKSYPAIEQALAEKRAAERAFESAKTADYITMRNAELAMFGAQNAYVFAQMAEQGYKSPELPYEVQLIRLGDTLIVGLQGELFVRYGLEIKKMSPYGKAFVFSVSNGYAPGYLYTPEAGREGGYEVGTSMFEANAGEYLLKKIAEEMKNV